MASSSARAPTRRIGAVARHYWHNRYLDALAKAEQAGDPALREIYIELANHYLTMDSLVGKTDPPDIGDAEA